jgi:hypothetical protein
MYAHGACDVPSGWHVDVDGKGYAAGGTICVLCTFNTPL